MKTSDAAVRSDNPSARRGQSKPRYMAEHAADSFDGLLSGGSTSRNAWTKSGGRRGWADAPPAHSRMFLKFTRDEDWTRGNRPIVYLTVKAAAKRLEILQVRRNERRLSGWRNWSSSLAGWRRSARTRSPPAQVTAKPVVAMLNAVPFRVGWRLKRLPAFRSRCRRLRAIHQEGCGLRISCGCFKCARRAARHCAYSQNFCGHWRRFYLSHENRCASVPIRHWRAHVSTESR